MRFYCLLMLAAALQMELTDALTSKELVELSLDEKSFEKVKRIHTNWYLFAVKALLVQVARKFLETIDTGSAQLLKTCLKRIDYINDLKLTAKCLVKTRRYWSSFGNENGESESSDHVKKFLRTNVTDFERWQNSQTTALYKTPTNTRLLPSFTRRRKETYFEKRRTKRSPYRLITSEATKSDQALLQVEQHGALPPLLEQTTRSPVHKFTNLFVSLFGKTPDGQISSKWSITYKNLAELTKVLESQEKLPGARVYDLKVYDLVMNNRKHDQEQSRDRVYVPPSLKSIFDLVNSFDGSKNARVLSPRIAPLLPDKGHSKGFLSPSLLAFYKDDAEEQILPIPTTLMMAIPPNVSRFIDKNLCKNLGYCSSTNIMLESIGMNESDRKKIVEMVMEVSGAREIVDNAMKILRSLSRVGLGDELLSVNEKVSEHFERLRRSMKKSQKEDLKNRGYTFMESKQMRRLYEDFGIKDSEVKSAAEVYYAMKSVDRENALWEAIAKIAGLRKKRRKRQLSVLQPVVLSPYMFAPVYGLSVLGPVVLSPNIFSPLILNPSVLGPFVLSPSIPIPFILSPYVLSPYVLSPLVMAPFILNPYVLSPNVINPYVLSPLILSPLVLCPDVLSPMVLSGPILSPAVLSPAVLSKSFLMANVLSPSLLS